MTSSDVRAVPPDVTSTSNSGGKSIWLPALSQTSAIELTRVVEVIADAVLRELPTYHSGVTSDDCQYPTSPELLVKDVVLSSQRRMKSGFAEPNDCSRMADSGTIVPALATIGAA